MPQSSALCPTAPVSATSHRAPKLLQPSPTADTASLDGPTLRHCIAQASPTACPAAMGPCSLAGNKAGGGSFMGAVRRAWGLAFIGLCLCFATPTRADDYPT